MEKLVLVLISLGIFETVLASGFGVCDPKICSDVCGTTGVDDFVSYTCNPFTCKCFCENPPPPNCLLDREGSCDLYCKRTYCGAYFGILCGPYQSPICTCACDPYNTYLRNVTDVSDVKPQE